MRKIWLNLKLCASKTKPTRGFVFKKAKNLTVKFNQVSLIKFTAAAPPYSPSFCANFSQNSLRTRISLCPAFSS